MSSVNGPVEALFSTQIPQEVWHYTNLAGLQGILSSGRIWATDVRFTKDKTEFIHAREIIDKYLHTIKTAGSDFMFPVEELSKMLDKAFDEGALSPLQNEIYVVSFSAAGDLKGQWVEFADNCRGVSIAFDLRNIRLPKELEVAVTFAPCVYSSREKELLIEDGISSFTDVVAELDRQSQNLGLMNEQYRTWRLIDQIWGLPYNQEAFQQKLQENILQQLRMAWCRTLYDLLRVASHCKNDAFSAEIEWRLALPRPKNRPLTQNIMYRGEGGTIPYLETNLFQTASQLPITRVRTGPLCEQTGEVQRILDMHGYKVPLIPSAIPLRNT